MDHNEHKSGVVEQAPASTNLFSTQPQQDKVAKTYPIDTNQDDCQLPEELPSHEIASSLVESTLRSPAQSQHNSITPSANQTTPLTLSAQTTRDPGDRDVMTVEACSAYNSSKPLSKLERDSTTEAVRRSPPLPLSESLGLEGVVGIVGGSLGILGILGLLFFLWFGCKLHTFPRSVFRHIPKAQRADYNSDGSSPEASEATWVWRQLALHNWMSRAVTVASIAIQLIVGIQATICTSMLAALLLERLSVLRTQVAIVSVMRGINDGPWKLATLLLSSSKGRVFLMFRHVEMLLIIMVALLSLTLQFASTILLSDMRSFAIIDDANTTSVYSLFSYPGNQSFALFQGSLMVNAPEYPVFGEIPTSYGSAPNTRGLSDTGLKQRGLLPMSSGPNRTSVRSYEGKGMVMSSRVACMQPMITNASLDLQEGEFGILNGILDYSQSLQQARPGTGPLCTASGDCDQVAFSCIIPGALNSSEAWAAGGCVVNGVGGNFRGPYQPAWDPADGPWAENSSIWLISSTNMGPDQWQMISQNNSLPPGQPIDNSEWNSYELLPDYVIKMSVCFAGFNFAHRDISMRAAASTREPSTPWSLVLNDEADAGDVETYLGLNPSLQTSADRDILELSILDNDTTYEPPPPMDSLMHLPVDDITPSALTVNSLQLEMNYELSDGNTPNTSFTLCRHCVVYGTDIHIEYSFLFSSILLGTLASQIGRAADALETLLAVAGFNVYDQFLVASMNVAEQVQLVAIVAVTVPGTWPASAAGCAGLIAVGCVLVVYPALVASITLLYVKHTRYSRYGNVWHVVSQLAASEQLAETLQLGNNAGDKAVARNLKMKGSENRVIFTKLAQKGANEDVTFT